VEEIIEMGSGSGLAAPAQCGDLGFASRIFFCKFDVQIYRFWCILTAIKSLVLAGN